MEKFICILGITLLLSSCEDVVDVELQTTEPKLVVNGVLRVDFDQEFVPVEIKVSETTNFFEDNVPAQLDGNATIFYGQPNPDSPEIIENPASSSLTELEPGSGIYVPDPSFDTDQRIRTSSISPNTVFILNMGHKGRRYTARTPFSFTVPIDNLEQGSETLFDEDETEVIVTITDIADEQNHYVFDFGFGDFLAVDDQFIDGQEFTFSYFYDDELTAGTELRISILGADQQFFDYIDLLVEQTEDNGGIFETPAATVRGNIFDVTDLDNMEILDNVERPNSFAFGYFAVVEEAKSFITIE